MHSNHPFMDSTLSFEERVNDLISRMSIEEKASQLLYESPAIERLGIPRYNWWNEALHGVARAGRATVFPQAIALAATFDEDLAYREAWAISDEARAKYHESLRKGNREQYKGLTFWTPNVNIFRDPRWGRGQETYGEDPCLTSRIGLQFVKGLQGDDQKYLKTAACAKHFAVHSGPEADRHSFDAIAGPKDMEETYLPAFENLVKGGVEAVMGAYNRTNGEVCCGSETLLVKTLREKWRFRGHVVSDCWAVRDFHEHHKVTRRPEESVALALNNGCDLNCGCSYEYILKSLEEGLIEEKTIDRSLQRALMTRMKLGMFDDDQSVPHTSIPMERINCREHRDLAREVARKSFVLLKNKDNLLPLKRADIKKMMVAGPTAADVEALLGNYHGISSPLISLLEGIAGECGEEVQVEYRKGCFLGHEKRNPIDWAVFEAEKADVTIACMGLTQMLEGEEGDALASETLGDRLDLRLPQGQRDFLDKLIESDTSIVLVLTGGSPIDLSEYCDKVDAILYVWYPGEEGGAALGDMLFGKVAPSGKLPVTFPRSVDDLPPFKDYSMKGRTYRYMDKEPLFPFGFGLTYSPFVISEMTSENLSVSEGENLTFTVKVSNVGTDSSDEIIQIYLQKDIDNMETPHSELVDFRRLTLEARKSGTLTIEIREDKFKSVNEKGERLFLKGTCKIIAGNCSPGKRGEELGASYDFLSVELK